MSTSCRSGCGACCIAPSISAPLPGFPAGKLAGVRCPHLTADIRCALFGLPERPAVCRDLKPQPEMCGESAAEAMATIARWEILTAPQP
ncbi:MAG: YkgJ family cysteine cluster protein [Deltaproteobacteria bacterium]|nr:YkgJ family cysteine cluster protein [Deltaproteobacteria bacterium]